MDEILERNRQLRDKAAELVQERNILAGQLGRLHGTFESQVAVNQGMIAEAKGLRQSLQVERCLTFNTDITGFVLVNMVKILPARTKLTGFVFGPCQLLQCRDRHILKCILMVRFILPGLPAVTFAHVCPV